MKGVIFRSVQQVECAPVEDPQLENDNDVIVRVEVAGLCGSDLHPYFGRESGLDPGTIMGHEFVGTIAAKGPAVSQLELGQRVFAPFSTNCGECFFCIRGLTSRCSSGQLFGWKSGGQGLHGGQAQFVRVPLGQSTLKVMPTELSADDALLLGDNFSTGFYCAEMSEITPDGIYVVIGCGTVGLLCIIAAKWLGAGQLIAIDPVPQRRAQAELLGAVAMDELQATQHIRQLTGGRGADAVMELVGLPEAQRLAYQLVRAGGILAVIGCHCTPDFAFSPVDAYDKNLTYKTGRCPARHYMDSLTDLVRQKKSQLTPFITHRFSIEEAPRAYEVFSQRKDGCIKAVFDMN